MEKSTFKRTLNFIFLCFWSTAGCLFNFKANWNVSLLADRWITAPSLSLPLPSKIFRISIKLMKKCRQEQRETRKNCIKSFSAAHVRCPCRYVFMSCIIFHSENASGCFKRKKQSCFYESVPWEKHIISLCILMVGLEFSKSFPDKKSDCEQQHEGGLVGLIHQK